MSKGCLLKLVFLISCAHLTTAFSKRPVSAGSDFVADSVSTYSGSTLSGLQSCGRFPSSVTQALMKAVSYKKNCPHISNSSKPIGINDYSGGTPYFYMFRLGSGGRYECVGKTPVAWGSGNSRGQNVFPQGRGKPYPCSGDSQKLTPPGFHLTAQHNGGRYNSSNSFKLVGLDGQRSLQRGVVMHVKGSIGGTTWGCPGVSPGAFKAIQQGLGTGALVYNYFGDTDTPAHCRSTAGMNPNPAACRVDSGLGGGPSSRGRYRPSTTVK